MDWALTSQRTAKVILDFRADHCVLFRELNPDAGLMIDPGIRGCQPDDFPCDGKLLDFIHQSERQKNLLAKTHFTLSWDEKPTIFKRRHVG